MILPSPSGMWFQSLRALIGTRWRLISVFNTFVPSGLLNEAGEGRAACAFGWSEGGSLGFDTGGVAGAQPPAISCHPSGVKMVETSTPWNGGDKILKPLTHSNIRVARVLHRLWDRERGARAWWTAV
jgi:hypothetical protein